MGLIILLLLVLPGCIMVSKEKEVVIIYAYPDCTEVSPKDQKGPIGNGDSIVFKGNGKICIEKKR